MPFNELAYIVEKTSKLTREQNLYKRLSVPLGMRSASADLNGYLSSRDRASLHQMQHGNLVALADDWPWMPVAYADRNAKVQRVVLEKFQENGPPDFTRD